MRRGLWMVAIGPALPGCPFVFGAPDLSNVDGAPLPEPPDPPEIVQFEVVPFLDSLKVSFAAAEGDASMLGGTVALTDGDQDYVLAIPNDLVTWDAEGISKASLPTWDLADCERDGKASWTLTITDSEGARSDAAKTELSLDPLGLPPERVTANLGSPHAPWLACAQFDGNTVPQAMGDSEELKWTAAEGGTHTIQLGWEGQLDVDLYLYDAQQNLLGSSFSTGPNWETVTVDLEEGETYVVDPLLFGVLDEGKPPFRVTVLVR